MPNLQNTKLNFNLNFNTDGNQIKFINGDAFRGLESLSAVHLRNNICINRTFRNESAISELPEILSQNCGFCEKIGELTNCELRWELKKVIDSLKTETSCTNQLLGLEGKLNACSEILKLNERIEAHKNETFSLKLENLENIVRIMNFEIEKLQNEVKILKTDNNDLRDENKKLKFKVQLLENN